MRILLIGGRGMKITDPSKFWTLATLLSAAGHTVRFKECLETGTGLAKVNVHDVRTAEVIIAYSYGVASTWHLWHSMTDHTPQILFLIAGVPDAALGQFYVNLWHAPSFVARAVCYDVN